MTAVALRSNTALQIFPNDSDWGKMRDCSQMLVTSGMLPKDINTPQKAMAIMMKGHELGIPPMQAFSQISVIKGKPTVSPELMLALILRRFPETVINYEQLDNDGCVMIVTRAPSKAQKFSFTMQDAKNAGLTGKDNWRKYARAMLRSRCVSEMARSLFPDVIMGASYTAEEMGVNTDENCQPIDMIKPKNSADLPASNTTSSTEAINAEFVENKPDNVNTEAKTDDSKAETSNSGQLSEMAFKIIQAFISTDISRYMLEDYLRCSATDWDKNHIQKARELFKKVKAGEISSETLSQSLYAKEEGEKESASNDTQVASNDTQETQEAEVLDDLNNDFSAN